MFNDKLNKLLTNTIIYDAYAFSIAVQELNDEIASSNMSFEDKITLVDKFNKHYSNTNYKKMVISCEIDDWQSRLVASSKTYANSDISNVKVSIVLPIYNKVEHGLSRALQSCINQTHNNIEIICVNDCSTDSSLEMINSFAKDDNRIIVVDLQENRKCSGARLAGWEIATGDYIVNVDPDDYIDNDYIEKMLQVAIKTDVDVIEFDSTLPTNSRVQAVHYGDIANLMFASKNWEDTLCIRVWGKIYKKDVVKKSIPILKDKQTVNFTEDVLLHTYLLQNVKTVALVNINSKYHYEINQDSITNGFTSSKIKESNYVFNNLCKEFNNYYTHRIVEGIMHWNKNANVENSLYNDKRLFSTMNSEFLSIMLNIAWERLDDYNDEANKYKRYKLHKIVKIIERLFPHNSIQRDIAKIVYKMSKQCYKFAKNFIRNHN